jgi:hypothetical protein
MLNQIANPTKAHRIPIKLRSIRSTTNITNPAIAMIFTLSFIFQSHAKTPKLNPMKFTKRISNAEEENKTPENTNLTQKSIVAISGPSTVNKAINIRDNNKK